MSIDSYYKTIKDLNNVPDPSELSDVEAKISALSLLFKTQDQFINIISIETPTIEDLFEIISVCLSPNLFLKHLMVLTDYKGEVFRQANTDFTTLFPHNKLEYRWHNKARHYDFKTFPIQKFSKEALKVKNRQLLTTCKFNDLQKDAIALLLFGNAYNDDDNELAILLDMFKVGNCIGNTQGVADLIKKRYIWFSLMLKEFSEND